MQLPPALYPRFDDAVQVAILLGFARPKPGLTTVQPSFDMAVGSHGNVPDLQKQVTTMQELMQKVSQALLQHGIVV